MTLRKVDRSARSEQPKLVDFRGPLLLENTNSVYVIPALTLLELLPYHSIGCVIIDPPSLLGVSPELEISRRLTDDDRDLTDIHEQYAELVPIADQVARVLQPGGCSLAMGEPNTIDAWEFAAQAAGMRRQAELAVLWDDRANKMSVLRAWASDKRRQNRRPRRSDIASMKMTIKWHVKPGYRGSYNPAQTIAAPTDLLRCRQVPILERYMPTQRPVALFDKLIKTYTSQDDIIVDPFVGTGSSLVAAEYRNRRWIAGDINPRLCAIARRRAANFLNEVRTMEAADWWMTDRAVKDVAPTKLQSKKGKGK